MQQNFISKFTKKISVIGLLYITLIFASACSEDDTMYTGILSIEINKWESEWVNHLYVSVAPLEEQDEVIKTIKLKYHDSNRIELNPGNYKILICADNNSYTPHIVRYVQIQIGKTETVTI